MREYIFHNVKLKRLIDGDTFEVIITETYDAPFNVKIDHHFEQQLRLAKFDTPETYRPKCSGERAFGERAKEFVRNFMTDQRLIVRTHKTGKYGRYIADVYVSNVPSDTTIYDSVSLESALDVTSMATTLALNNMHKTDLDCRVCPEFTTCDKIDYVCESLKLTWPKESTNIGGTTDGTLDTK